MNKNKKILLGLMPFWDPLIPPLGISLLKSFIQEHGFPVKTVDLNVKEGLGDMQRKYFGALARYVPENKRRHLYNIGYEVLKNHMMAHIHYRDEKEYTGLVKILVYQTFFTGLPDSGADELTGIVREFYLKLIDTVIRLLEQETPSVLGLSVYSGTLPASLFAFKLAKELDPGIQTVMGGGIFSGELAVDSPDFVFFRQKTPYIDTIIAGEGEKLFLEFLQGKLPAGQNVFTANGSDRGFIDLAGLAPPDYSGLDTRYYVKMASHTSRSCPFRCKFCVETVYWGKYRKRRAREIAAEAFQLFERYRNPLFLMCDSLLNPVIDELAREFITSGDSLYWGGYLRVDPRVCDIDNTIEWRRGGFYRARLGIESGSQKVLDAMNKKLDTEQIKQALSALAQAGIKTTAMFVIGYPGETEADFRQTLDFIEEKKDDIYEADCNPFWYFLTGQVNSPGWSAPGNSEYLYPREATEMLVLPTRVLQCEPSREETYRRVNRFLEHCRRCGVPDPYTLYDLQKADERWKKLHENAVPSILEIKSSTVDRNECKKIKKRSRAEDTTELQGDWNF